MNPDALIQARQRFARAEKALEAFEAATNYDDAESSWSDLLLATATIYSKLEQGAKGNGTSEGWFGRQKKRRRAEQILRYLHYARNSDEHGIVRVTERRADNTQVFDITFKFGERKELTFYKTNPDTGELGERKGKAWACGPCINLIRARDSRYGDYCDPPDIPDAPPHDPLALGRAALPMIEQMLDEANKLI